MNSPLTRLLGFFAVCILMVGAQAMGEEHAVSGDAFSSLGLGKMQRATDAQGLSVRGHGSVASVGGGSWAFGGITVYSPFGTWSQGGIDADSYSAIDKAHYGSAHASAEPRGAVVRIPQMDVEVLEQDSAGNLVTIATIRIVGGVAAGNTALQSPRTSGAWAGAMPMALPYTPYGWSW